MLFLFVTLHSCVELNPGDDARVHGDSDLSETTKLGSTAFKNSVPFFFEKRIQSPFKLSLSSLLLDSTPGPSLQDGSSQHHQKDQTQGKGDADSHGVSIILWFQPFYFSHGPSKCIRLFILGFRCSLCSLSALKDSHYRVLGSHSWFFLLFGGSMIW